MTATPSATTPVRSARTLREQFDRSFALAPTPPAAGSVNFLLIRVGSERHAIRLTDISGLHVDRRITALPSAMPELLGVTGFRGLIVPVYQLAALLGQRGVAAPRWLVLLRASAPLALAFDTFETHICATAQQVIVAADGNAGAPACEAVRIEDGVVPVLQFVYWLNRSNGARRAHRGGSMAKDPYRYFRIEARELVDQLSKGILELEQGGDGAEQLGLMLRWAHTLKGAARVVRQVEIADLIHGMEEVLAPLRSGPQRLSRGMVDQLLATLDQVSMRLAQLPQAVAEATVPATASAPEQRLDAPLRVVRADVLEVDVLLEGLGEIGNELAGMRRAIGTLDAVRKLALAVGQPAPHGARALVEQLGALERSLAGGAERIDRELRQTRDAGERLRLIPVASIFSTLERCARDAAHSSGKLVGFEARCGQLRIDGEVLDAVLGALLQMVRNAVAHGIETPAERSAAGKAPAGRVTLDVSRRGDMAWFRCHDDGRGVDLGALRRLLIQGGRPVPADDAGLLALLLEGGISTSSVVTELSGRGIGMDVARAAMAQLGGKAYASTSAGDGTTFELCVPLSLAALDVLLVEADGQARALPLDAVCGTLRVPFEQVVQTADGGAIVYEEQLLPLLPLTLGGRGTHQWTPRAMTAVVIRSQGQLLALAAERLAGIDNVVLRALPPLLAVEPIVLGLYLDSEGEPRMVLDPEELGAALVRQRGGAEVTALPALPILIVDDSLTTRMLESSILESAGYQVALAASAEEGLELARLCRYALFLVDVEMPGMDGFGFIAAVRADPQLSQIPALLVTSLDTPAHRQRGSAVGANGYIVKNEFDQTAFLAQIGELVQR
ncbi:chemotaxis protein CheW [Pseudoduganella sp. UC29_106]|uniref:chemotaxis protein CheW n=1 Tax=Pseudoduganella sp. UC29_106 TaxID=3374553 RepID=UPI003757A594